MECVCVLRPPTRALEHVGLSLKVIGGGVAHRGGGWVGRVVTGINPKHIWASDVNDVCIQNNSILFEPADPFSHERFACRHVGIEESCASVCCLGPGTFDCSVGVAPWVRGCTSVHVLLATLLVYNTRSASPAGHEQLHARGASIAAVLHYARGCGGLT